MRLPWGTACETVTAALGTTPSASAPATGTVTATLDVVVDGEAEWRSAWTPATKLPALHQARQEKKAPASFNLGVTKDALLTIMSTLRPLLAAPARVHGILTWQKPLNTVVSFIVFTVLCWFRLFVQSALLGLAFLMWAGRKQGTAPESPRPPPEKAIDADDGDLAVRPGGGGFSLGFVTQTCYTVAQLCEVVDDIIYWRDPATSKLIFLGLLGGFVGSFLVPVWLLVWLAGVYLFSFQALYTHYPLLGSRFPPHRLIGH
eukprot:201925_1